MRCHESQRPWPPGPGPLHTLVWGPASRNGATSHAFLVVLGRATHRRGGTRQKSGLNHWDPGQQVAAEPLRSRLGCRAGDVSLHGGLARQPSRLGYVLTSKRSAWSLDSLRRCAQAGLVGTSPGQNLAAESLLILRIERLSGRPWVMA